MFLLFISEFLQKDKVSERDFPRAGRGSRKGVLIKMNSDTSEEKNSGLSRI